MRAPLRRMAKRLPRGFERGGGCPPALFAAFHCDGILYGARGCDIHQWMGEEELYEVLLARVGQITASPQPADDVLEELLQSVLAQALRLSVEVATQEEQLVDLARDGDVQALLQALARREQARWKRERLIAAAHELRGRLAQLRQAGTS